MKYYIFIAALVLIINLAACSPSIDIEVSIHDIHYLSKRIADPTIPLLSFRYTIKNDNDFPVWFHRRISFFKINVINDTLSFETMPSIPIFSQIPKSPATKIEPGGTIHGVFTNEDVGHFSRSWWYNSNVEYIELNLIFTILDIEVESSNHYEVFLAKNKIVSQRVFRIDKL